MTDTAKTRAPCEVLFGEVVAAHTGRVGWESADFDLLRRHLMADVASDFGMLLSPVIEGRSLATDLRTAGLRPIRLRPLEIRQSGFFCVRWKPKVSPSRQQARQSEYALFYSRHRQVILRVL